MQAPFNLVIQATSRVVRYGQESLAHVGTTRLYIWARPIFMEAGAESLSRGHAFAAGWALR
jgi:hypothetical protein